MRALLVISLLLLVVVGCSRNQVSEDPPIHLNPNMDEQPKVKQQSESRFYADGLAMRQPVEGTVARGQLHEDSAFFYTGMTDHNLFVCSSPLGNSPELLKRGEERFGIFCAPCHASTGDGKSIMVEKKMPAPPSLHEHRLRDSLDGYFYHVITNGYGNMPTYKYQIPPKDRWMIVSHIRALQSSHPAVPNSTAESRLQGTN